MRVAIAVLALIASAPAQETDRVDIAIRALDAPAPRVDERLLDNDGVRYFLLADGYVNGKRFGPVYERLGEHGKMRLLYVVLYSRPLQYPDRYLHTVIDDERRSDAERYLASRAFAHMRGRIDRTDCVWDGERYRPIDRHLGIRFKFAAPPPKRPRDFKRVEALLRSRCEIFKTPAARKKRAAVIYGWIRDGYVVSALAHYRDHYLLKDVLALVDDGLARGAIPVRQAAACFLFFEDVRRGQKLLRNHWVGACNDGHGELMDRMFRLFGQRQDAERIEANLARVTREETRQRLRRTLRILRLR